MCRLLPLLLLAVACRSSRPTVWVGGDLQLGDGTASALAPLAPLLAGATGLVNLEGPVGATPAGGLARRLANGPAAPAGLKSAGIRVAGIANDHADDAGPEGRRQTRDALARAGVLAAGLDAGPAVLDVAGTRVVVTQHDLTHGVPADLALDLKAARAKGDLLIAMFHVTGPSLYLPRPELREAAEVALAAGAKVVAAHGTHALGPVERRGDAVIAWGLGNLAFGCDCTDEEDGLVLLVTLDGAKVADVGLLPIAAGLQGRPAKAAEKPGQLFDLLEAIGTKPLRRDGARAWLATP